MPGRSHFVRTVNALVVVVQGGHGIGYTTFRHESSFVEGTFVCIITQREETRGYFLEGSNSYGGIGGRVHGAFVD